MYGKNTQESLSLSWDLNVLPPIWNIWLHSLGVCLRGHLFTYMSVSVKHREAVCLLNRCLHSCRSMTLLSMCLTSHIQISSVHWKEQSTTRSRWRDDLSVFSALSKTGRAGTQFENPLSLSHPFWCLSICLSLFASLSYAHEVPQALISTHMVGVVEFWPFWSTF